MSKLTHLDAKGQAYMVDISAKPVTAREAAAEAVVTLSEEAFIAVMESKAPKGDVLAAARIAGIMAAKKVSGPLPLRHPIGLAQAQVEFEPDEKSHIIRIATTVTTSVQKGV